MNSCDSEDEVPNLELSDSDQDHDVLMDDEVRKLMVVAKK